MSRNAERDARRRQRIEEAELREKEERQAAHAAEEERRRRILCEINEAAAEVGLTVAPKSAEFFSVLLARLLPTVGSHH